MFHIIDEFVYRNAFTVVAVIMSVCEHSTVYTSGKQAPPVV